jgi:REP element-mobilizing transposase RayT
MVIATHAVFAAYGFWPPNDPRGSWSDHVWAEHLKPFGDPIKVSTRRSVAHLPHDRELAREIRDNLKYPRVRFNDAQRAAIAEGIAEVVELLHVKLYALAILHDHVHFVSQRHTESVETIIGYMKRAASRLLRERGLHPMSRYVKTDDSLPTPWVRGGWKRFIDRVDAIPGAIEYVNGNFAKSGLERVEYPFLVPFVWAGRYSTASRGRDG